MRIALFGAAGLEGERLIEALEEAELAVESLVAIGDEDADIRLFRNKRVRSNAVADFTPGHFDCAIFLRESEAGAEVCVDDAVDAGLFVLDASGVLAQRDDIPLFGMTPSSASNFAGKAYGIADAISSQLAAFLAHVPALRRVDCAAQCSVSALGRDGVEILASETARLLNGMPVESSSFDDQLAFNCVQQDEMADEIEANLSRLLIDTGAEVCCSAATVPVFYGHSLGLRIACAEPVQLSEILANLAQDSRFELCSGGDESLTPVALLDAESIKIGHLSVSRRSQSHIRATLVGDNLRKGVVINIIALLKILIKSDS